MGRYKASYYTRAIAHRGGVLLFNGASGALVRLETRTYSSLSSFLGPPRSNAAGRGLDEWNPTRFEPLELPEPVRDLFADLVGGGFFVPADRNEQEALKFRMEARKSTSPLYVRITTTMDCNYDCYYCFEDKSSTHLTRPGCDAILEWIERKITEQNLPSLFTDWFGGEPMLNRQAIEYISERAIRYCEGHQVYYSSAITCNGSRWPTEPLDFVRRNRIRKIQLTLDGPSEHHRRRRKHKAGTNGSGDTFQAVVDLVDELHAETMILLRINVDPGIGDSVLRLVPYFRKRGWLAPGSKVYPYLALIGPMNNHCGYLDSEKFRAFRYRFDEINREFQARLTRPTSSGVEARLPPYPTPMKIPCSAVAQNSVIFGPDGMMYKCVLDVGRHSMAFGRVDERPEPERAHTSSVLKVLNQPSVGRDAHSYLDYDPFEHERCSQCQYLPVCMGGCPKDQFEKNDFYLQERSVYWENNFERLVKAHADRSTDASETSAVQPTGLRGEDAAA